MEKCCGKSPEIIDNLDEREYQVTCNGCGRTTDGHATMKEAIDAWNEGEKDE